MSLEKCVRLTNARLSFPHIADPQKKKPGQEGADKTPLYGADFIVDPNGQDFASFMAMVAKMAQDKWKEHANNVLTHCQQDRKKRCYGWGQEKVNSTTYKILDGYEGMAFITANNKRQPQIFDAQGVAVDPTNTMAVRALASKLYGGCRVNAVVKPWLQENEHGRGIRCELVAIQFLADDAPFGEGVVDASGLMGATPAAAAGTPPGMPPLPPLPGAAAPAAPAWGAPAVPGMPPAPYPAVQAPPVGMPPMPPAAPGLPSFLK